MHTFHWLTSFCFQYICKGETNFEQEIYRKESFRKETYSWVTHFADEYTLNRT